MTIQFNTDKNQDTHGCQSHREGDWIIFTCPFCKNFERRLNFVTGEFIVQPDENPHVLHQGSFHPVGFEVEGSTAN